MADFNVSFAALDAKEGKYSNVKGDPGGETYRGISRNNWANWPGWIKVDAGKSLVTFPACLDVDVGLQNQVSDFYHENFWFYDALESQPLADKIFQIGVNIDPVVAHRLLQRALNSVMVGPIVVDGNFGAKTVAAVNAADSKQLWRELCARQAVHYALTYGRRPDSKEAELEQFLLGWMRRAVT